MFHLSSYIPSRVRRLRNRHRRGRLDLGVEQLEERSLLALSDLLYGSAFRLGSTGFDVGKSIAADSAGNYYIAGGMEGTIDFDPGLGAATRSGDSFAAKYSASGALLWAKTLSGDFAYEGGDVAVDSAGCVYLTSSFQGTVDFDPGAGTYNLSSPNNRSPFVLKLSSAGTFEWAQRFAATKDADSLGIAVDAAGNVYAAGIFGDSNGGTIDLDPGSGTNIRTSAGQRDVFVASLTSAGNYRWGASAGGAEDDKGVDVGVDGAGNVYVAGEFMATADFDPGPGQNNLTSAGWQDAFIWKLGTDGSALWAKQFGGAPTESPQSVAVDTAGNIYTTGYFWGDADFDPGPDVFTLSPDNSGGGVHSDVFVSKLGSNGSFAWAKRFGGPADDQSSSIAVDATGRVCVFGVFQETADFDPGAGTALLASAGMNDVFVARLSAAGEFLWAGRFGGASQDQGYGVAVDNLGNVYGTGFFQTMADFDPGPATANLTSAGQYDAFVSQLVYDAGIPTVTINQAAGQADPSETEPINFTVVFSEPVLGFVSGDVTFTGTAPGSLIGTVTQTDVDGAIYNVAVTGMTGSGTVIANVGAGVATDVDANSNAPSTSTDNQVQFGTVIPTLPPGVYYDVDGDKYTVKFKGPGTARLAFDDPDGDGKSPIDAILLEGTTIASTLSVSVSKAKTGDGKVSIGQITSVAGATGDGSLKSLSASKSNVTGAATALNFAGGVGTITLGGIIGGGDVLLGGSADASTKITVSGILRADEIRSGRAVSSLKATSIDANSLIAPALGAVSTTAGSFDTDLDVTGTVKKISTKKGGASGEWTAATFGTLSVSGGGFAGQVISTATAASLGKKAAISKFSTTGDFQGTLHAAGIVSSFTVGGSVNDSTIAGSSLGTFKVTGNLSRSVVLAGANLGADYNLEGLGSNADTFGVGSIKSFAVGGAVSETMVGAGLDPNGMIFRNGNDLIAGGTASKTSSFKIVGAAGAENYFRAGTLPKSVKIGGISVDPLTDARFQDIQIPSDVETTNDLGTVTLSIYGNEIPFQFLDELSGQPIPGLVVGASADFGVEGLAVLEAFDPTRQYPPRFVVLHGGLSTSDLAAPEGARVSANSADSPLPLRLMEAASSTIEQGSYAASVYDAIELKDRMPSLEGPLKKVGDAGSLLEAVGYLVKFADNASGGRVAQALGNAFPRTVKPISNADALAEIRDKAQSGSLQNLALIGLAGFAVAGPAGTICTAGMSIVGSQLSRYLDEDTVINAAPDHLVKIDLGFTQLYAATETANITHFAPTPLVPTASDGNVSGGYIEMISKDRLGDALRLPVGASGQVDVQAPVGDYEVHFVQQGRPPVSQAVTVPDGGGPVTVAAPARNEVATLRLIANPPITGLLDPDTQIEFSVEGRDAAGNVVPVDPALVEYEVFNPVGSNVATIDPATGLLMIGPDQGAVRVVARYGDTKSNLVLASGLGAAASLPIVLIDDVSIVEGNNGTQYLDFNLRLNQASTAAVSVDVNTAWLASANPGEDYTDISKTFTFKAGKLTPTTKLLVPIKGDYKAEGSETFAVGLSKPVGARLSLKNSAVGTITDDDAASILLTPTTDHETSESGGTATFTVKLASQPAENVTIQLATRVDANEGTVSPATYTFTPTNWSTAKTFTVTGADDALIDGDRAYQVYVSSVTSTDPAYSGLDLSSLFVNYVNKDNDQLGKWQIYIQDVVGGGFVVDNFNPHRIDTDNDKFLGTYPADSFFFLHAYDTSNYDAWLADWVDAETGQIVWSFSASFPVTPNDYEFGLSLIVYINGRPLTADAAASPVANDSAESIGSEAAAELLGPAVDAWASAGLGEAQLASLRSTPIGVTDLPDRLLATYSGGKIWLDRNAAGFGWFVDFTPLSSEEFERASAISFRALETSPAADRMDLLTALNHELGHALGLGDLDESLYLDDVMAATLAPGVRRTASSAAIDSIFANGSWLSCLSA